MKQKKRRSRIRKPQRRTTSRIDDLRVCNYYDVVVNQTVSTTVYQDSLLDDLTTLVFATNPPVMNTTSQNGVIMYRSRILIEKMELTLQFTGSQSNTITSADLFNCMRFAIYKQDTTMNDTNAPLLVSINAGVQTQYQARVYMDRTITLVTQAFDTQSNYNVPQVKHIRKVIKMNQPMTYFKVGSGGWDAQRNDIILNVVSDSSLSPSPTLTGNIRVFYCFL
jgi:hypothetical protein